MKIRTYYLNILIITELFARPRIILGYAKLHIHVFKSINAFIQKIEKHEKRE
jgi:hypothetical protein